MEKAQNIDIVIAPPRMARYIEISTKIFGIYGKYIASEDIHVYSVDEVFIDATNYLKTYKMTPNELAIAMIKDVLIQTGITATAGIGENLYLAKIAMDIVAKHLPADENGVRIAELTEKTYREKLWTHEPLTDFWRVGRGISKRLQNLGIKTMGDLARYSITGSDKLYKEFGINAELLIDHAWGYEPVELKDIKNYKSSTHSLSAGQVLAKPYPYNKARIVIQEMADNLTLEMMQKGLFTNQVGLTIIYDIKNLKINSYNGETEKDFYGRTIPKKSNSTQNIQKYTASVKLITKNILELFDKIVNRDLLIRKIYISLNHVVFNVPEQKYQQLDMFKDYTNEDQDEEKARRLQAAEIAIRQKYGKNAILKAISLEEGATAIKRNQEIGGHKA